MSDTAAPRTAPTVVALIIDLLLIVAFAAIGRASHEEAAFAIGLITTAWPFTTAAVVGWVLCRGWRAPASVLRTGLPVWAITVIGGMLLRMVSGQGTAPAFIIVATLTLALFLLGWRGLAALSARIRARRS